MNVLRKEKQELVLNLLVEGNSIRSIERISGVSKKTIGRLIRRVGVNCQAFLDESMRNLTCAYVECDEIWTFVYKKQDKLKPSEKRGEKGDQYVFVALDRDTKLVPVFVVGKRTSKNTIHFMGELKKRISNRFQLSTDKYPGYFDAVDRVFGADIDYATIKKSYHGWGDGKKEGYRPSTLSGVKKQSRLGKPEKEFISTSFVERQNLTIRTQCKRFTRLTNAFSKSLENLQHALSIHFWHYNFMREHSTLKMTPAMEAGVVRSYLNWNEVLYYN